MGKIVDGIYYDSKDRPAHRGVVKVDGKLYYAGKGGEIAKDEEKLIHHGMANGLVKHGTYYFGKDGVIDESSFKKPKKKKTKSKNDKKTPAYIWAIVIAAAIAVCAFIVFFTLSDRLPASSSGEETGENEVQYGITVQKYKDEVYLCTPQMERYYKDELTLQQVVDLKAKAYSPFVFKYTVDGASSAVLTISEQEDFSDAVAYELDIEETEFSIDNLKTGTTYYYKVSTRVANGESKELFGSFTTAKTNRFIYLPGVNNTRDIGGYETLDHRTVKQGLLIRGSEMDGLVESKYYLTDPAAAEPFGFVYDFDLRNSNIINTAYVSRLGEDVGHKFYYSPSYGNTFTAGSEKLMKQIFTDLADENNYPMYLHCTYGADRTGTIVFFLQGLLGVPEEDMRTEYTLSAFYNKSYADASNINPIYSGLEGVEGNTINEKIENYLIGTIGITEKQIESIRSIFLEG